MIGCIAAKSFVFGAACTLVSDQVRIGSAQTCGANGLVCIHHNMLFCCLLDGTQVVIVGVLTVMMLATRDNIAYVTTLNGIVTILLHEVVCRVYATFIVVS